MFFFGGEGKMCLDKSEGLNQTEMMMNQCESYVRSSKYEIMIETT